MKKISTRYYARDDLGAVYSFSNDLVRIARLVKRIFEESETFSEVKEKIKQNEDIQRWLSVCGREIKLKKWYVRISDKSMSENSWKYEQAEIFLDNTFEKLEEDRRKVLSWIENCKAERFIVEVCDSGDYAIGSGFMFFLDEIEKLPEKEELPERYLVSKENLIECIRGFFEYLWHNFRENGTPAERAVVICRNNPCICDDPDLEVKLHEDWKVKLYKNKIVLSTRYLAPVGADYKSSEERVEIHPVK